MFCCLSASSESTASYDTFATAYTVSVKNRQHEDEQEMLKTFNASWYKFKFTFICFSFTSQILIQCSNTKHKRSFSPDEVTFFLVFP